MHTASIQHGHDRDPNRGKKIVCDIVHLPSCCMQLPCGCELNFWKLENYVVCFWIVNRSAVPENEPHCYPGCKTFLFYEFSIIYFMLCAVCIDHEEEKWTEGWESFLHNLVGFSTNDYHFICVLCGVPLWADGERKWAPVIRFSFNSNDTHCGSPNFNSSTIANFDFYSSCKIQQNFNGIFDSS